MSDLPAETVETKPALKSLTLQSLVTVALSLALGRAGAALPYGAVHDVAGAAIDFLTMIGMVGAAVGRVRADKKIG